MKLLVPVKLSELSLDALIAPPPLPICTEFPMKLLVPAKVSTVLFSMQIAPPPLIRRAVLLGFLPN